ncbi:MAG: HNH endonuclease [Clostridiales Family XIII bacterium]|nr:HNH endonuclease [Clostridiales Family XIII bacterium]
MKRVLSLNKNFIPIRFINKYEAICKIFLGVAIAITFENKNYIELPFNDWVKRTSWPKDQEFVHSATMTIAVPRTIRYLHYDKIPKVTLRLSRRAIYIRDNYTCYICGKEFSERHLSIDHIIPLSRGGKNTWENMITCCLKCNWKKGDKLLNELGIKPKFSAKQPISSNIQKLKTESNRDYEEWKFFGV